MKSRSPSLRVFGAPVVVGTISVIGLISALLGDGLWDAMSWIALVTVPLTIGFYWSRSRVER